MPEYPKPCVMTQFINASYDMDWPRTPPFVPFLFNGFAFVILARGARSPSCPSLDLIGGNETPVIVKNDRKDLRHCRAAQPRGDTPRNITSCSSQKAPDVFKGQTGY